MASYHAHVVLPLGRTDFSSEKNERHFFLLKNSLKLCSAVSINIMRFTRDSVYVEINYQNAAEFDDGSGCLETARESFGGMVGDIITLDGRRSVTIGSYLAEDKKGLELVFSREDVS